MNARIGRALSGAAVALIVVWIGFDLLARSLSGGHWPDRLVDYQIIYHVSRQIVATGVYPADYPYPPSAVVLHWACSLPPLPVAAAIWTAICGVSAVGCWLLLARLVRLQWDRGEYLLLPIAHLACSYFFQWDLRSANCNLLFLFALLLGVSFLDGNRLARAGFCIALAFSLKLFCVLVIPYLLWKRRFQAFAWTIAAIGLFWIVLPAIVFGPRQLGDLYVSWYGQLSHSVDHASGNEHPIATPLARAAFWLSPTQGPRILMAAWGAWFVLGLFGWYVTTRRRVDDAFGLLTDVALLTLGPIAVSPYLEPYHPVPFAIPALLLVATAADRRQSTRLRSLAGISFAAALLLLKLPLPWEARGLLLNAKLFVGVGSLVLVDWFRKPGDTRSDQGVREKETQ